MEEKGKKKKASMGCIWSLCRRNGHLLLVPKDDDGDIDVAAAMQPLSVVESLVRTYPIPIDEDLWIGNLPLSLRVHPQIRIERDYRGPFPPYVERWSVTVPSDQHDATTTWSGIVFVTHATPPPVGAWAHRAQARTDHPGGRHTANGSRRLHRVDPPPRLLCGDCTPGIPRRTREVGVWQWW